MAGKPGRSGGAHGGKVGRPKGIRNKATIEKALIAEQINSRAEMAGKKLAKEVLDDFMQLTAEMAAFYQPAAPGHPPNQKADEAKFWQCMEAAHAFAKSLAPYQSPTFRAVAITADVTDKGGVVRFVVENAPLMIESDAL